MNETQLSKRLELAASFVQPGARLADIGSDHAYLPCYLAQKEIVHFAIAGEVVIGPFTSAKKQIQSSNLTDKVEARLGDGLAVIGTSDQIDTITICGMGGDLIARILDAGKEELKLEGVTRLILQPNNAEAKLRRWLIENEYAIIEEKIIEENDKIYEIVVAEPSSVTETYSKEDYLFGKRLRQEKNEIFKKKWQSELEKIAYILQSLDQSQRDVSSKKKEVEHMRETIEEEIS
ncbi:tRNA (adenine(22)-N(1))-methyltransferase [Jeotgalibaca caeni]|uniref:tRNA (adenine(22)-N(1))-methyltransferase n=1 Tax=Jeotgalibaca caeni TaxID=3028623 RepID=UPI00237D51E1|nr:tRNA (adenine(22)-N(1))-methyltransferase TrmK [Jeotgalibaca caeni]MDE1549061.1 tRNA (adenine(22)-N(1))-methyltransferase TrmK [Jeotgalibaca caeni]